MSQSLISVVIPAYNEEKTVGAVLCSTLSAMESYGNPFEVIVVDDGSTDNTRRTVSRYKTKVLSNRKNQGKGKALRKGFQHAQGDIIITMDADGAHTPKEIPDLIDPLFNGVDIVAGSRFLGSGGDSTSRLNRFGNLLFNLMILIFTGKYVTDSQTGFRAFKREVLQRLSLVSVGYEIDAEITVKGLKNGFIYQERPISCQKRRHSVSKLKILSDGITIIKTILKASSIDMLSSARL